MLLSGLRDAENAVFDYVGEPYTIGDSVAGMTLPSTLAGWLAATNRYTTVENDTNIVLNSNRQKLLSLIPTSDVDIVLFINARAVYDLLSTPPHTAAPEPGITWVPDHYVLLTAPFAQYNDPTWLNLECWTWGQTYRGWLGTERCFTNYFGSLISRV